MLEHEFVAATRAQTNWGPSYDLAKKNRRVVIDDDVILTSQAYFSSFKAHWWHIGRVFSGLEYHGITIIANEDLQEFIDNLKRFKKEQEAYLEKSGNAEIISELFMLCIDAKKSGLDIVHFGV